MATSSSNCALLSVNTKEATVNKARDVGRPAVRTLLGLAYHRFPMLLPQDVLWEGPLVATTRGIKMAVGNLEIESRHPNEPLRVSRIGMSIAPVSVRDMPHHVARSLLWLAMARAGRILPEQFVDLWLAIRSIVDYKQPNQGHQMTRVRHYTATMGHGVAGVISPSRIDELNRKIGAAYQARTALLHRDNDSLLNGPLLDDMERVAMQLVEFELAKSGIRLN